MQPDNHLCYLPPWRRDLLDTEHAGTPALLTDRYEITLSLDELVDNDANGLRELVDLLVAAEHGALHDDGDYSTPRGVLAAQELTPLESLGRDGIRFDVAGVWVEADDACNTCSGLGVWNSTTEESPTELVNLGNCPECYPPTYTNCLRLPASDTDATSIVSIGVYGRIDMIQFDTRSATSTDLICENLRAEQAAEVHKALGEAIARLPRTVAL